MCPTPRKKIVPDKFGRKKTFGYPIDISGLENRGLFPHDNTRKASFLGALQAGILRMCIDKGNPLTDLLKKEEEELDEVIKKELSTWLTEALKRLPANQEISIYLRFNLDSQSINKKVRTTQEVGNIIGVAQRVAWRNIDRGLKNLRKDFKKNLAPKFKRLKS